MVDRLAVRDGEDPAAQVRGVTQSWIGAQRGQPRLLITVVGIDAADRGDEEAVDITGMGVEQLLEWRQGH